MSYSLRLSGGYSVIGVVSLGQSAEVNGNSFDLSVITQSILAVENGNSDLSQNQATKGVRACT